MPEGPHPEERRFGLDMAPTMLCPNEPPTDGVLRPLLSTTRPGRRAGNDGSQVDGTLREEMP